MAVNVLLQLAICFSFIRANQGTSASRIDDDRTHCSFPNDYHRSRKDTLQEEEQQSSIIISCTSIEDELAIMSTEILAPLSTTTPPYTYPSVPAPAPSTRLSSTSYWSTDQYIVMPTDSFMESSRLIAMITPTLHSNNEIMSSRTAHPSDTFSSSFSSKVITTNGANEIISSLSLFMTRSTLLASDLFTRSTSFSSSHQFSPEPSNARSFVPFDDSSLVEPTPRFTPLSSYIPHSALETSGLLYSPLTNITAGTSSQTVSTPSNNPLPQTTLLSDVSPTLTLLSPTADQVATVSSEYSDTAAIAVSSTVEGSRSYVHNSSTESLSESVTKSTSKSAFQPSTLSATAIQLSTLSTTSIQLSTLSATSIQLSTSTTTSIQLSTSTTTSIQLSTSTTTSDVQPSILPNLTSLYVSSSSNFTIPNKSSAQQNSASSLNETILTLSHTVSGYSPQHNGSSSVHSLISSSLVPPPFYGTVTIQIGLPNISSNVLDQQISTDIRCQLSEIFEISPYRLTLVSLLNTYSNETLASFNFRSKVQPRRSEGLRGNIDVVWNALEFNIQVMNKSEESSLQNTIDQLSKKVDSKELMINISGHSYTILYIRRIDKLPDTNGRNLEVGYIAGICCLAAFLVLVILSSAVLIVMCIKWRRKRRRPYVLFNNMEMLRLVDNIDEE